MSAGRNKGKTFVSNGDTVTLYKWFMLAVTNTICPYNMFLQPSNNGLSGHSHTVSVVGENKDVGIYDLCSGHRSRSAPALHYYLGVNLLKRACFEEVKGSTWSDPPILTMTQSAPLSVVAGAAKTRRAAAQKRRRRQ